MKKLFNRLSTSGHTLREDASDDEEEHLDTHIRKPTALPADARDTSQDIKVKKSFSSGGAISSPGKTESKDHDSSKKKSSSTPSKNHKDKENKESKDKDKLNESGDKALRKSASKKKQGIRKSTELKDPDSIKSPTLKGVFVSEYEHEDGSDQSDNDDSIPRSHGKQTLDDDEFYSTTPIRVPSAPGRLASSPYTTPTHMASPRMDSSSPASAYAAPTTPAHMASPRMDYLSPASAHSPPKSPYVAPSPSAQASTLSRSVSSPNPATATPKRVVPADDFDLRFAGAGHARTDSVSDETALGGDFARNERFDAKSEEVEDAAEHDEVLKQKGKGLFSFGSNKPKKLK